MISVQVLHLREFRLDISRNFFMGKVVRPWKELPRELWSAHLWRCHLEVALRALGWGQGGDGAQLGLPGLGELLQPK